MSQQGSITINGFVAADPVSFGQAQGIEACSFRLGCTRRYYNSTKREWIEHPTTWMTVKAFRSLATNVRFSVHKGDPLLVTGLLNTETWQHDGTNRSRIVVEATAIGHDLALGVSTYQRTKAPNRPTPGIAEVQDDMEATAEGAIDSTTENRADSGADMMMPDVEGALVGSTGGGGVGSAVVDVNNTDDLDSTVPPVEQQWAGNRSAESGSTVGGSEDGYAATSEYASSEF